MHCHLHICYAPKRCTIKMGIFKQVQKNTSLKKTTSLISMWIGVAILGADLPTYLHTYIDWSKKWTIPRYTDLVDREAVTST